MPIVIELTHDHVRIRELTFDHDEIAIGRTASDDIVLTHDKIGRRHARIVRRDDRLIVVHLGSPNGTGVNGETITSPVVIQPDDKISIGVFVLQARIGDLLEEDDLEVDATERRLQMAVAQREEGSRLVYADWLEAQGDMLRGEFLRMQDVFVDGSTIDDVAAAARPMYELAMQIDARWRQRFERPPIVNCSAGSELACPQDWGSLSPIDDLGARFCDACSKRVYYCRSPREARAYVRMGNCVAADVILMMRSEDFHES